MTRALVEFHQRGAERGGYGQQLLELFSARLQQRVGRRYSVTNLRCFRLFYQTYAEREPAIRHKAADVSTALRLAARPGGRLAGFSPRLSWSHDRTLTKVENPAERAFYEIEAELQDWIVPHLARQIHTRLFARLLKSRDKRGHGPRDPRPSDRKASLIARWFTMTPSLPRLIAKGESAPLELERSTG